MKKLLPQKKDLVMFILGFLPAFLALIDYLSLFIFIGDLAYIFNIFCYPIVILLIGALTSKYTSTLFCAGTSFISWAALYLITYRIINLLFYHSYDFTIFEAEDVYKRVFTYAIMTLVVLAARGLVTLIIYTVRRIRKNDRPGMIEEQRASASSKVLNAVLIILCAIDIAGFLVSLILFRGMNTLDSIPSIMIAAASLFGALILEFLITILPKNLKFAVILTIVFNVVFIVLLIVVLFVFEILPLRFYMGGAGTALTIILFPIVHIVAAALSLIIRKVLSVPKKQEGQR